MLSFGDGQLLKIQVATLAGAKDLMASIAIIITKLDGAVQIRTQLTAEKFQAKIRLVPVILLRNRINGNGVGTVALSGVELLINIKWLKVPIRQAL